MKIGAMNDPAKSVYDEIVSFGKAGFDFVDLTIEGPRASNFDIGKVQSIIERYNLFVTGHTDPCLPWAYPIKAVQEACLNELERCAAIFSELGANIMNIHPCYFCPPAMRSSLVEFNIQALKSIVKLARDYGLTVIFENYKSPFDSVQTFELLLQEVSGLGMHLDFGHANIGKDSHGNFCRRLGSNIRHVHFSDNRSTGDDHMPLGVGNINWKSAIRALKSLGYDSTITLEVFCNDPLMRFQYLELSRKFLLQLWDN